MEIFNKLIYATTTVDRFTYVSIFSCDVFIHNCDFLVLSCMKCWLSLIPFSIHFTFHPSNFKSDALIMSKDHFQSCEARDFYFLFFFPQWYLWKQKDNAKDVIVPKKSHHFLAVSTCLMFNQHLWEVKHYFENTVLLWNFNVEPLFHQVMLANVRQTTVWRVIEALVALFLFAWATGRHCNRNWLTLNLPWCLADRCFCIVLEWFAFS